MVKLKHNISTITLIYTIIYISLYFIHLSFIYFYILEFHKYIKLILKQVNAVVSKKILAQLST